MRGGLAVVLLLAAGLAGCIGGEDLESTIDEPIEQAGTEDGESGSGPEGEPSEQPSEEPSEEPSEDPSEEPLEDPTPDENNASVDETEPELPPWVTTEISGQITLAVTMSGVFVPGDEAYMDFEVPTGARSLLVEVQWTPATEDVDLDVFSPAFCPQGGQLGVVCGVDYWATGESPGAHRDASGLPGQDDGYARVEIPGSTIADEACEEETCDWRAWVNPKLAHDVDFDLAATVFLAASMPDDFTAFEG